jgi:hypothetical protein
MNSRKAGDDGQDMDRVGLSLPGWSPMGRTTGIPASASISPAGNPSVSVAEQGHPRGV